MKKILVTTDGSKNSNKALLEAKKLAEMIGADVDILSVMKDIKSYPYVTDSTYKIDDLKQKTASGEKILEESLKLFEDFKGEAKTKLRRGDPGDEIIKEAEKGGYDLIIMGSRGLGTFSRAMLGSVTNKVLNHVKTNVMIIK